MSIFAIILAILALLIALLYILEERTRRQFESKGVPYRGNVTYSFILNAFTGVSFIQNFTRTYNRLKSLNAKVAGGSDFGITKLLILDPDIIKSVLVKDFDHFVDRAGHIPTPKNDYLFAKMLLVLKGDQWKALRSKLSPAFTTGKIKRLFALFDQSGKKLVKFIEDETTTTNEMDLSTGYSKFAMDVIASAVCSMNSKAFEEKDPSVFEKMGDKLRLRFGAKDMIHMLVIVLAPKLANLLGFSIFDMEMQDFFSSAIKGSIHDRQEKNEKRNDFIQLMLEAREDKLKAEEGELSTFEKDAEIKSVGKASTSGDMLDDTGIVANCVLFVLAGFDTTQSLLLFCAYALALNQDVQDKLREEVETVLEDNGGEFSYESIHKMTYLDMVISETLRVYPPAGITERTSTQDYQVPGTDYVLKKGGSIQVNIAGLHQDPEYFPEPEKFDPERFSMENKAKINQYAYLPFGAGPRNCIGMRFALTEVKVAISHLVHNFRIEPSQKTLIPMKYTNENSLKPKGGMFLALNKIQH
ncbi:cytochrome P450 9e2 [Folsomia candida]|uniref:cytochrome P450 9e2 n=1 Tax=Folsomia candida TaxID=158441 RepID=UPI000B8FCBFE|nr:cytochrome P450 9e2 [Folsomia candida]